MAPFKLPPTGKAIADMTVSATVHKSRKPKFELHLKIYDLNNVPLVSGVSSIKWHLPHSLNNDHRGRTSKQPIANHRVDYGYAKIVPVRLVVDRNNRLSDCPIEFEITQEFETHGTSRDEKVLLGKVSINLAEYVAESEAILRSNRPGTSSESPATTTFPADPPAGSWHTRNRSSISTKATLNSLATTESSTSGPGGAASTAGSSAASVSTSGGSGVEDGVTRRYLLQDSKVNSTLKISILMVQIDGEHNFIAPALKSAAVFGGITGIMAGGEVANSTENVDEDDSSIGGVMGALMSTSISKGYDAAEIQDVYRRALAASWACQSGELPADECIEDIFSGGDGFRPSQGSSAGSAGTFSGRHGVSRGGSMASAVHRSNWAPSSPTHSSIYEGEEEEEEPAVPSAASSGGKKHCARIIPKLGPLRRKTLPNQASSGAGSSGSSQKTKNKDGDTSSGEDAASIASGSNQLQHQHQHGDDEGDHGASNHATLRPRDLLKFRGHHHGNSKSASTSGLAALRFPSREDSSYSDRTVMPQADMEASSVPRSSRGSPGPHAASLGHGRNGSNEDHRGRRGAHLGGGRMPSGGRQNSGSGRDEHPKRQHEVNEYEVRDNFVAWQLPAPGSGSITAS